MKKISIPCKDIKDHLSFLSASCNKSGADFTAHCVFELHAGELFLSTFNNRTYSIIRMPCLEAKEDINLKFSIEFKRLDSFLKSNKVLELVLEHDVMKQHTTAKLGSAVALLPTYKPSWLPSWSLRLPKGAPVVAGLDTLELKQALEFCKVAVSNSDSQPDLAVIGVKNQTASSTDHKLAAIVSLPSNCKNLNFYVHSKNLTALSKFLGSEKTCNLHQTPTGYLFQSGTRYFGEMQRLLEPVNLSYADLSSAKHTFKVNRERLLQAYNSVWSSADWTTAKPLFVYGGDRAYVGAKTQFSNFLYEEITLDSSDQMLTNPISLELTGDFLKVIKTLLKKDILDFYIVGTDYSSFLVVEDMLSETLTAQNILITKSGNVKWEELRN